MRRWLDQRLARNRGFTIVELLIVIAVIGILATIVIVGYGAVVNNAHDSSVKSDLQKIDDAFKLFALDSGGTFPDSYSELGGLGIKIAAGSYDTATKANMYVCMNASGTEYAVIAMSRSLKRFVVKSESGISQYAGGVVWDSENALQDETCESIDPTYESANGITGMTDGTWLSWTGAEGSIASIICPGGFIVVPGNSTFGTDDFCVMKYEAKDVGGVATSEAAGTPWGNISQPDAMSTATAACSGCHLITDQEWMTIAHNVFTVGSNWTGGSVGSGNLYRGMNDSSPSVTQDADTDDANGYYATGNNVSSGQDQRRTLTLSNGEVIWDFVGNIWEWTTGTITGNQPGGATSMYREWNALGSMGGLPAYIEPDYGNPALGGYTTAEGIGAIYSSTAIGTLVGFYRGGGVNQYQPTNNGVFNLALDRSPTLPSIVHGFRVAR